MVSLGKILGTVATGGIGGSVFGDTKQQAVPTRNEGFAALPPQVQQAYLNMYLPEVLRQYQQPYNPGPMGQAPMTPFSSLGLQELQNYSNAIGGIFGGGTGVYPIGQIEPFNQYQQEALKSFGAGLGNRGPMSNQMAPFPAPQNQQAQNITTNGGYNIPYSSPATPVQPQMAANPNVMNQGPFAGAMMGESPADFFNRQRVDALRGNRGYPQQAFSQMSGNNPFMQMQAPAQATPLAQMAANMPQTVQNNVNTQQAQMNNPANVNQPNQGYGLLNELADYMNPYNEAVLNQTLSRLGQETDKARSGIMGRAAGLGGLGAFGSSALGTQLGTLENERLNRAADLIASSNLANYNQALGLRRQTLNDMLQAGNAIQQQGQNVLNVAYPNVQATTPMGRLGQLSSGLAGFPQSGQSIGYQAKPDWLTKLGGLSLSVLGMANPGANAAGAPGLSSLF